MWNTDPFVSHGDYVESSVPAIEVVISLLMAPMTWLHFYNE